MMLLQKHHLLPIVEMEILEKPNSLFFGNFPIKLGNLPSVAVK
jgi:hypothetical protein